MFSLPSFLLVLVLLSLTIVSGAPNNQNNQGNDNKVNKCLDSFRYVGNSAFSFAGSSKANLELPVTFDLNKCSKIDSVDILIGHDGQTKKCNSLDFRYLHSGSATVTCDNIKGADLASDSYTYTVSVQKDKTTVSFGKFKVDIYCESGYTAGSSSWHKRNNGWSGGYNNGHDNDNKKCVPCPWGTYSDGKSECKACDKGSEPPKGGSGTCVLCPAGQSSDGNNGKCYDCPKDTFAAYPGSAKCKPCEHGHKCGKGSKQCYPEATQYWHRRSALERARRCPPTYISCSVSKEQWECVDAMNDIQSCGGCWSEGTGQDCTLLLDAKDRHASVACVKGQCKVTSFLPNFKR